jgi:hypothetical protein
MKKAKKLFLEKLENNDDLKNDVSTMLATIIIDKQITDSKKIDQARLIVHKFLYRQFLVICKLEEELRSL